MAFRFTTLFSDLYLGSNFEKSTFAPALQCGNQTCWERSLSESKICKPLIKPTKELFPLVFNLFVLSAFSVCFMIFFDLLGIKLPRNGHEKVNPSLSLYLFVVLFAAVTLYLSSKNFEKQLFCAMNWKETICRNENKYKHEGALHTIEEPIYISAPCEVSSRDFDFTELGNSDILNIDTEIDDELSPCSFELRSDFFIERYQMNVSVSPNDFVLLNGEPLEFVAELDFFTWSKEGSSILNP